MIRVIATDKPSGTTLLTMEGHVPEVLCAWFSGFTAAVHALYGGRQSIGSGLFVRTLPTKDARQLLRAIRRVARKHPEHVVVCVREKSNARTDR